MIALQEQWHIYHSEHHGLYTMYITLPRKRSLCSNWREAGLHMVRSFNRVDFPALEYCSIELQDFPDELRKVFWKTLKHILLNWSIIGNLIIIIIFNQWLNFFSTVWMGCFTRDGENWGRRWKPAWQESIQRTTICWRWIRERRILWVIWSIANAWLRCACRRIYSQRILMWSRCRN